MKWIRFAVSTILTTVFMCGAAQAQQFVGSFLVDGGPEWTTNPPVYSAQEAAALIFGGSPSEYVISTNSSTTDPTTITHTAYYSGWGESCVVYAENYRLDVNPAGYNDPGGEGTARSAYVSDHCGEETNYVWRVKPVAPTPVPTLSEWGMIVMSGLIVLATFVTLRRRNA